MEADQTGERIRIVNEYKTQTGQPLVGDVSLPFGFKVGKDESTGRKKVIKDTDEAPLLEDLLNHYLTHQSKRKTLVYMYSKHNVSMSFTTLSNLLKNTMIYGAYRDNPAYCEAYIDKETFDKIQDIAKRNIKDNTTENKSYIFSGLIVCPHCGRRLKGNLSHDKSSSGKVHKYKKYRCAKNTHNKTCEFSKAINERTLEKLMLKNIEGFFEDAKLNVRSIEDAGKPNLKHDIDALHTQIERLNYSWQTGKIRKVETYEKNYAELLEKLEQAEAEQAEAETKDFGKIEAILQSGWREIYDNLDDAYKRAFWRSFVRSIEVNWTTDKKEIVGVNFF